MGHQATEDGDTPRDEPAILSLLNDDSIGIALMAASRTALVYSLNAFRTMKMSMGKDDHDDSLQLVFLNDAGDHLEYEFTFLDQSKFVSTAYALLSLCPQASTV